MAGKLFISKQYFPREIVEKNQLKKIIKKILSHDLYLPYNIYDYYFKIIRKKTITKLHSRCRFSGRAKANFNKFKMSRMFFKRYGEFGRLNGIRKSSW